tara:strand:+ start:251 stop:1786 length:1536 start_codon:yes stop_codon:yes gene_type:complete
MGKRLRDEPGASGHRRPRVDLSNTVEPEGCAVDPSAPDYENWNRTRDEPEVDPVQAAIAAKAKRAEAHGPLGEHLAGYGEDDNGDGEGGDGGRITQETQVDPPWVRLMDAKTGHPYFWNKSSGAVVWTLGETKTNSGTDGGTKLSDGNGDIDTGLHTKTAVTTTVTKQPNENITPVSLTEKCSEEVIKKANSLVPAFDDIIEKLNETLQKRFIGWFQDLMEQRLNECESDDSDSVLKLLLDAQSKLNRAISAARGDEDEDAKEKVAYDQTVSETLPKHTTHPPPLPPDDEVPPLPPPPPSAVICKPPELSTKQNETPNETVKKKEKKPNALPKTTTFISKPNDRHTKKQVERWNCARKEVRESALGDGVLDDAARREREVQRWRDKAARGEEANGSNANLAPVSGDWRERAAAAKLRREREAHEAGQGDWGFMNGSDVTSNGVTPIQNQSEMSSAAADAAAAANGVDVGALSKGLPSGWRAFYDADNKSIYYGNSDTSQTQWDPPPMSSFY